GGFVYARSRVIDDSLSYGVCLVRRTRTARNRYVVVMVVGLTRINLGRKPGRRGERKLHRNVAAGDHLAASNFLANGLAISAIGISVFVGVVLGILVPIETPPVSVRLYRIGRQKPPGLRVIVALLHVYQIGLGIFLVPRVARSVTQVPVQHLPVRRVVRPLHHIAALVGDHHLAVQRVAGVVVHRVGRKSRYGQQQTQSR